MSKRMVNKICWIVILSFIIFVINSFQIDLLSQEIKSSSKYYHWLSKDYLLKSNWIDDSCFKSCLKKELKQWESIQVIQLFNYQYFISSNYPCSNSCKSIYAYDNEKGKVHKTFDFSRYDKKLEQYYFEGDSYLIIYALTHSDEKNWESGLVMINIDTPLKSWDIIFRKNRIPREIERCDSLFCVTVHEYETHWFFGSILNFMLRSKAPVWDHDYIASYMYKFDKELNLISIEELPIDKELWEQSRKHY